MIASAIATTAIADAIEETLQTAPAVLEHEVVEQSLVLFGHRGELHAGSVDDGEPIPDAFDVVVADLGQRPDRLVGLGQRELELHLSIFATELQLLEPRTEETIEIEPGRRDIDRHRPVHSIADVLVEQEPERYPVAIPTFGMTPGQDVEHVGNGSEFTYESKKSCSTAGANEGRCRR